MKINLYRGDWHSDDIMRTIELLEGLEEITD
jgi:hypothetical protein